MLRTPFLVNETNLTVPPVPDPTATSGDIVDCGTVCSYISEWTPITKADVTKFEDYFDKYYPSHSLHDDQKILNGLYMKITGAAPFDLGASNFVHACLDAGVIAYLNSHDPCYVAYGHLMDVRRQWEHVLSQMDVKKGTATASEKHTVSTGTSLTSTNTSAVTSAWGVETHQTVSASGGLDIGIFSTAVAGEMGRAESNSGSKSRTTSSQFGMTEARTVEHNFTFNGPQPGEPDPINLTWWQLTQMFRLGAVVWFTPKKFDVSCPKPSDALEVEYPRYRMTDGGWCEVVQRFDTFQLSRG